MNDTRATGSEPKNQRAEGLSAQAQGRGPLTGVAPLGERADGPVVITPKPSQPDLLSWAKEARDHLDGLVDQHKALLFRGFGIETVSKFQGLLASLGADLLEYSERSTPRSTVEGRVYTSTEYPNSHEIPMHNENSYSAKWPRRILFCCLQPAQQGGATPIADSRAVYAGIDESIRRTFLEKKVMYLRNFGQGVDLSWQDAFQTEERQKVEAYCRSSGISYQWFDNGNCLHTHQVRPAALSYLPTGERVWFNQAHLFHISSLEPSLRRSLSALFSEDRLPRHACYGDGSPIEDEILEEIRGVYERLRMPVEWQKGDVLLLDNLFYAHGRFPFAGQRRVVVAMDGDGRPDTSSL